MCDRGREQKSYNRCLALKQVSFGPCSARVHQQATRPESRAKATITQLNSKFLVVITAFSANTSCIFSDHTSTMQIQRKTHDSLFLCPIKGNGTKTKGNCQFDMKSSKITGFYIRSTERFQFKQKSLLLLTAVTSLGTRV